MSIKIDRYSRTPIEKVFANCDVISSDYVVIDDISSVSKSLKLSVSQGAATRSIRLTFEDARELGRALMEISNQ